MKKLSILVLMMVFVFAVSSFASAAFMEDGNFAVKIGMDFNGKLSSPGFPDSTVKSGLTINGEYLVPYSDNLEMGAGLSYQMEREEEYGDKFNFTTLYGLAKMYTDMGKYNPYFVGQVGYGLLNYKGTTDTKNGLYYGFGAGMSIGEGMDAEVLYSVNKGKVATYDFDYSSIRAGVSFAF